MIILLYSVDELCDISTRVRATGKIFFKKIRNRPYYIYRVNRDSKYRAFSRFYCETRRDFKIIFTRLNDLEMRTRQYLSDERSC